MQTCPQIHTSNAATRSASSAYPTKDIPLNSTKTVPRRGRAMRQGLPHGRPSVRAAGSASHSISCLALSELILADQPQKRSLTSSQPWKHTTPRSNASHPETHFSPRSSRRRSCMALIQYADANSDMIVHYFQLLAIWRSTTPRSTRIRDRQQPSAPTSGTLPTSLNSAARSATQNRRGNHVLRILSGAAALGGNEAGVDRHRTDDRSHRDRFQLRLVRSLNYARGKWVIVLHANSGNRSVSTNTLIGSQHVVSGYAERPV